MSKPEIPKDANHLPSLSDVTKWAEEITGIAAKGSKGLDGEARTSAAISAVEKVLAGRGAPAGKGAKVAELFVQGSEKLSKTPVGPVAERFVSAGPINQMIAVSGGVQAGRGVMTLATLAKTSRSAATGKIDKAVARKTAMSAVSNIAIGAIVVGVTLGLGRGLFSGGNSR